ncbi:MAG TPA: hypothetical protein VHF51_15670 [Solirubrobacteraceae bacterium]|nr:hypothetical protein [Solirubrobacteraceae bacterium]
MSLRRLRAGEWLAAAGAVALLGVLFLDWFEPRTGAQAAETAGRLVRGDPGPTGWSALGWLLVALLVVVIALAAWLVVATAGDAPVSQPVMAGVLLSALAPAALVALAIRVAIAQPGAAEELLAVQLPAYLGLAALTLVVAGAWRSIGDERTKAPESAYTPPPPRPAPPERI